MVMIFSFIFGAVLAMGGINVVEQPIATILLIAFYVGSIVFFGTRSM
jgi:hypothetical protein